MSFLTPLFLLGLVGLAVPVIIHLIQRERKNVVQFPSLMFLQRIPYQSVQRRRIRNWPLLLLRLAAQLVGVELETRIRDVQWLTRRMRDRERDGGTDHVLLVLSASAHNRRVLPELLEALGPEFETSARAVLKSLREGRPIPGSAVILL